MFHNKAYHTSLPRCRTLEAFMLLLKLEARIKSYIPKVVYASDIGHRTSQRCETIRPLGFHPSSEDKSPKTDEVKMMTYI